MLSKNSYWLKSGIYTILEKGLTLVFSFGTVFMLYRKLSLEEVGIWTHFITITTLLELARNGLIQNALVKFLSTSDKESYSKILSSSILLNIILTAISILLLSSTAELLSDLWHAPILASMFYIYIITTLILLPFYHFQFIEQANLSFKGIFYSTMIRQGIFFILIFIIYFGEVSVSLLHIAVFQIISVAGGALACYVMTKKYLRFDKSFDIAWVKKLFHFGKFVFGTNINSVLFSSIDQMMLGNMVSNKSVGLYNLAIKVSNVVDVPTSSVASIVFPQSAKRIESLGRPSLKNLYEKSVGLILGIIIPISIIILIIPNFLIYIIGGNKYLPAAPILQITIFYTLLAPFTRQFGTIIDSMGNPRINFYFTLGAALLNVGLNYIFINVFGVLGAAYGTLCTYLVMFVFSQIVLADMFKVNILNIFKNMLSYYKQGFSFFLNLLKRSISKVNSLY